MRMESRHLHRGTSAARSLAQPAWWGAFIEASGLPVTVSNWRGVVAAENITDDQEADIVAMVEAMHASDSWQESLSANQWTDFLQTGADFEAFLEEEKTTVGTILVEIGLVDA
jgi:putative tricarboxylic transport membrane protein